MFVVPHATASEWTAWLHTYSNPATKVHKYWQNTYKVHLQFIHRRTEHTLGDILLQWPHYKEQEVHLLVKFFSSVI